MGQKKAKKAIGSGRNKIHQYDEELATSEREQDALRERMRVGQAGSAKRFIKRHVCHGEAPPKFHEAYVAFKTVQALKLTNKDLRKLKIEFDLVDLDHSGSIEMSEFFAMLDEPKTPYTDALFKLIDLDGNERIDFDEFVHVCGTYCVFDLDGVLEFVFNAFNTDGTPEGKIYEDEFITMMKAISKNMGDTWQQGPRKEKKPKGLVDEEAELRKKAEKATAEREKEVRFEAQCRKDMRLWAKEDESCINFAEFIRFGKKNRTLTYPAFRLQDKMQKATLSYGRWKTVGGIVKKRRELLRYIQMNDGAFPPLGCFPGRPVMQLFGRCKFQGVLQQEFDPL